MNEALKATRAAPSCSSERRSTRPPSASASASATAPASSWAASRPCSSPTASLVAHATPSRRDLGEVASPSASRDLGEVATPSVSRDLGEVATPFASRDLGEVASPSASRDLGEVATPSASRDCSAVPGECFAQQRSVLAGFAAEPQRPVLAGTVAEQAPAEQTPAAPKLIAHATPFTDRYPWEATPAESTSAPSSGYASAHISHILLLPADVSFLSSEDLDIETLFSEETSARLFTEERPILGASVAEPTPARLLSSETSPDLLPSLIKSLVLPAGLPLRLRALALAGHLAALA